MVTIVNPVPDSSVVKRVICKNCGVELSYVPNDIQRKTCSVMCEIYVISCIECPTCNSVIEVE